VNQDCELIAVEEVRVEEIWLEVWEGLGYIRREKEGSTWQNVMVGILESSMKANISEWGRI
jgi:hypothetical protein